MSLRRFKLPGLVVVILLAVGAAAGREVVEVQDAAGGEWKRIRATLVWAWESNVPASARPEAPQNGAIRVTRWFCYGLHFHSTQQHSARR